MSTNLYAFTLVFEFTTTLTVIVFVAVFGLLWVVNGTIGVKSTASRRK